jgi:hypothetical protein
MQAVVGTEPLPYQETVTRLALPRLDYRNADGTLSSTPRLLLEPQRTNSQTYSEDFSAAVYLKSDCTVTTNTTTAPDGTLSGDTVRENTANSVHRIQAADVSVVAGTSYTLSLYAKNNGRRFLYLNANTAFGARATFDLQSGVISETTAGTAKIETLPNGWYRCSVSGTAATTRTTVWFGQLNNAGVATDTVYTGDGTSGLFFWGAQVEAGAYPTTYIPTTTAAVTRLADACSLTGASSIIGQTEGTVIVDVNLDSRVTQTYFAISSSATTVNNYIGFSFRASTIVYEVVVSGAIQAADSLTNSATGRFKLAIGYKANDFVFYVNGNLVSQDNSGTVPACNDIVLYNASFSQAQALQYNKVALYTTRLSNEQLQALTTL